MLWPRGVRRTRGVEYTRSGAGRCSSTSTAGRPPAEPRPAIVQVHGGGWIVGSRSEQGIPLLNHLAAHGWVGFNIDYRLSPSATFPDHVVDVKRAIAWVREHADEYGVDPEFVCITGGSAGGHLCALAALTADDPAPARLRGRRHLGRRRVPFYGVYDLTDAEGVYYPELPSGCSSARVQGALRRRARALPCRLADPPRAPDAPPFWSCTATATRSCRSPTPAGSSASCGGLREPVVYAELAGAEHAFDIVPKLRTARVVETIERFLATIHAGAGRGGAADRLGFATNRAKETRGRKRAQEHPAVRRRAG